MEVPDHYLTRVLSSLLLTYSPCRPHCPGYSHALSLLPTKQALAAVARGEHAPRLISLAEAVLIAYLIGWLAPPAVHKRDSLSPEKHCSQHRNPPSQTPLGPNLGGLWCPIFTVASCYSSLGRKRPL
ncbi:hypothetical protein RRG08_008615 [Elysia crispata]|uniref:Uncharacterized protein n=1 Tax=Elysia crispata TaxID=231223 RepID=A0AAE1B8I8_9GAST|nr:hypothetical protein RRG08_008615 [Elysia crispata]